MATSSLFGWDLTFKTVSKEISAKHDVLITFVHWNLIKSGFSCLGIGDEKTKKSDDVGSELLPDGWSNGPTYALRYLWHDDVYILHGILSDGNIIFNLLKGSDLSISNLALNIDDTVTAIHGPIATVIPQYNDIMHKVRVELIEPVTSKITKSMETQTASSVPEPRMIFDPLGRPCGLGVDRGQQGSRSLNERFGNIGSSDLNPLHGGGRGMLFDPFQENYNPHNPGLGIPGGLPRGAVPPGARFDPFSPLAGPGGLHQPPGMPRNPGGRGFPDADHLPPPGYDDMFM